MKTIVLLGPPNTGKSTIFNQLTGKHAKTVNYPGSTVDISFGPCHYNADFTIVDTPGIISLTPRSEDEKIAVDILDNQIQSHFPEAKLPDLVLSIVDLNQISRHLLVTKQLIEKGYPVCVVLTMEDLCKKRHISIDIAQLQNELNCPVISVNALKKGDITRVVSLAEANMDHSYCISTKELAPVSEAYTEIEAHLINSKYSVNLPKSFDWDQLFLHPIFGGLAFLGIMTLFFYAIFVCAAPFMGIVEQVFAFLSEQTTQHLPQHLGTRFLSEGIINGIAAILVFVPQIALLFFAIGILESTGYLARGAVLVDKPLSYIGLNGRCFVPLLSGYACAIPAMLATRTIKQRKVRLLCNFIIPLMQCSARLPVYGLLLTLLFGSTSFKGALVFTSIYAGSIVLAALMAAIANPLIPGKSSTQFNIELPQWRRPDFMQIITQVQRQTLAFVKGAGPMILIISMALWILSTFPTQDSSFAVMIGQWIEPIFKPMGLDWRVGVAILLSFAAREVFVSALVVMFSIGTQESSIVSVLQEATIYGTNTPLFTAPAIGGLLVFFMIAMQCASTLAVAKKELNSGLFAAIQLVVYIGLAYVLSVGTYQGLTLLVN